MKKIYVIEGSTGEYSDRCDWLVKAFTSEAKAEEFVKALDDWLRINQVSYREGTIADYEIRDELKCPHDPSFRCDYTGTRYHIIECELEEE